MVKAAFTHAGVVKVVKNPLTADAAYTRVFIFY